MNENYRPQHAKQLPGADLKKKKRIHNELFHFAEILLISKGEDDRGHCKVPLSQICPENYALSTPVLHCA